MTTSELVSVLLKSFGLAMLLVLLQLLGGYLLGSFLRGGVSHGISSG